MKHKGFKPFETLALLLVGGVIALSEWAFLVEGNPTKAVWLGLWAPTMVGLLIYITLKSQDQ